MGLCKHYAKTEDEGTPAWFNWHFTTSSRSKDWMYGDEAAGISCMGVECNSIGIRGRRLFITSH